MRTASRAPPSLEELVRDLFGALAEGVPLASAANGISQALDCHVTGLHHEQPEGSRRVEIEGSLDMPEMIALSEEYERRWQGQNLWIERSADMLRRHGYQCTDRILPKGELLASTYYQNFLRRMDVAHAVGIRLTHASDSSLALLSFNRTASRGAMSEAEVQLVARLRPHLVNAYALYDRMAHLRHAAGALRAGFDCLPFGALVLAHDGRVLQRNAPAEALLGDPRSGIAVNAAGMIVLGRLQSRAPLAAALREFAEAGTAAAPKTIVVSRTINGANRNLVLHLCAVPLGTPFRRTSIIALLQDLDTAADETFGRQALQAVMGLTAKESETVLTLRACGDVEATAARLGVQVSTVRSHLKSVFTKAGVSRQSELVRLADRLVGGAPGGTA